MTFHDARPLDPGLPPAHNDCACDCHRIPGVKHAFPCCTPEGGSIEDVWSERTESDFSRIFGEK